MEKGDFLRSGKKVGREEEHILAEKAVKQAILAVKEKAGKDKLKDVKNSTQNVFHIAKQMKRENKDMVVEKCIRDDSGNLANSDEGKKKASRHYYERLLNVEFLWRQK